MRREREPVERDIAGGFPNPLDELAHRLAARGLRRHEAEHDELPVRNRTQGCEGPRPIVVVLEQQPVSANARKDSVRKPVVPALDEPAAGLVSPAEVEAEGDVRMIADHVVVQLETQLEPPLGRPAAALVELPVPRIDQQRVLRRVQLDVRRAEPHQLVDLLAEQLGDVLEECFEVRIGRGRTFGITEVGVEARARKRHLEHTVGAPAHVGELLGRQRPFPSQLPDHRKRRPLDVHLAELGAPPIAPEERVEVPVAEAVDGRRELTLEGEPAHLAVGDDVEARLFLERDRVVHGLVLDPLERRRAQLTAAEPLLRGDQFGWAQEAADDVGAGLEHVANSTAFDFD